MDFSVETAGPLGRKLRIRVAAEEVRGQVEKRLRKLCKSVRLDGFRPGKAPLRIVEQRFGGRVFSEVASDLMQSNYTEVLQKELLKPAGYPRFEEVRAEPGRDLEFTASIEVYPEFEAAPMESAVIEKPVAGVTAADVEQMVERVRKNRADWKTVSRPARAGDRLTLNFGRAGEGGGDDSAGGGEDAGGGGEGVGGAGENAAAGADAAGQGAPSDRPEEVTVELGASGVPSAFNEDLAGVCAGDRRRVRVPTGDGGEAEREVAVHAVEEPVLPALDEAFFSACGVQSGGLDGLRAMLREGMENELRARLAQLLKQRVMAALLEHNEFDVPAVMVEQEIATMRKEAASRFRMKEEDGARLPAELFRDEALRRVRLGLLLHRYAEQHDIRADRASFEARLDELAASYEDPESVKNHYRGNERMRRAVEALAVEDQVVARVLEAAQVSEKTCSFDEIVHSGPEKTSHATQ
ncbi:MAG: trigger factor [Gammaproteobacteria bacterium]|nr:trigger factor [Gammaproteobacteria bacterium]